MTDLKYQLQQGCGQPALTRRKFLQATVAGTIGIGAFGLNGTVLAEQTRGIRGSIAPKLSVPHWIDGQGNQSPPFSIAQHRGKWIYLKCFQEWCPACHSVGFPNLKKLKAAFPDDSEVVAAVIQTVFEGSSVNTVSALRKNQLRYDLALPFGHDPGDTDLPSDYPGHYPKTMVSYRTGGTPWVALIDPNGVVAFDGFHIDVDALISYLQQNS